MLFELLQQQEFARNALLAGTIVALVASLIGYFVVLRSQAFAGHALSHIGFAGATGATLLGLSSLWGMILFTLLAALGMGALGERIRGRDVEIGMVLSFALGLGVLFLNLYTQHAAQTVSILFGSILSVSRSDVLTIAICSVIVLLCLLVLARPLLFASVDPVVARARGVPVRSLSIIFLLLLALTIAQAVQVVGVLLVFALLIAPPATAMRLTRRPLTAALLSVVLGLAITWGGLVLTFVGHWSASFYISALATLAYLLAVQISRFRSQRRYKPLPHPCRECLTEPA